MARATNPLRVALAILAGTVLSPLFFALGPGVVAFLDTPGGLPPGGDGLGGLAITVLFIWLTGLLFGGPIALAAILGLFGPAWLLLHRAGAQAATFVGCAALAAGVAGLALLLFTAGTAGVEGLETLPAFLIAGALTGAIMWPIAYAGAPRRPYVGELPQANFTAAEPSA